MYGIIISVLIFATCKHSLTSFNNAEKNGFNVLIIGKPNDVKRSLMNDINDQDVSIVTDIPRKKTDVI